MYWKDVEPYWKDNLRGIIFGIFQKSNKKSKNYKTSKKFKKSITNLKISTL